MYNSGSKRLNSFMPNLVAARPKALVCGRLLAGVVGSNPAGGMAVCLLWALCVCCQVEVSATSRSLVQRCPAECGASLCVMANSQWWEGLDLQWLLCLGKKLFHAEWKVCIAQRILTWTLNDLDLWAWPGPALPADKEPRHPWHFAGLQKFWGCREKSLSLPRTEPITSVSTLIEIV